MLTLQESLRRNLAAFRGGESTPPPGVSAPEPSLQSQPPSTLTSPDDTLQNAPPPALAAPGMASITITPTAPSTFLEDTGSSSSGASPQEDLRNSLTHTLRFASRRYGGIGREEDLL